MAQRVYRDLSAQSDYGEHGRRWDGIGVTADGTDEDGDGVPDNDGCAIGPESPLLRFARYEQVMIPQPLRSDAGVPPGSPQPQPPDFDDNEALPVTVATIYYQGPVPLPPPPPPCVTSVSAQNSGTGSVNLNVTPCAGGAAGYRIYRANGSGSLALLKDIRSTLAYTDYTARHGQSYRYAVTSYNTDNDESTYSAEVLITAQDTTPPGVPTGLTGTAGDRQVTFSWNGSSASDIYGYNVYLATIPGGPYQKLNSSPEPATLGRSRTLTGLQNGVTYYITVSAVDIAGNESAKAPDLALTPAP